MSKQPVSRVLREFRFRFSRSSVAGSPDGLFCSLLLEDFSSVDLKDTRDLPEMHLPCELFFCGNSANFVEITFRRFPVKAANRRACRVAAAEW